MRWQNAYFAPTLGIFFAAPDGSPRAGSKWRQNADVAPTRHPRSAAAEWKESRTSHGGEWQAKGHGVQM